MRQQLQTILYASTFLLSSTIYATGNPPNLHKSTIKDKECGSNWVYETNGVHSDCGCDKDNNYCLAKKDPSEPKRPKFPDHWISDWTMFTVMNETAAEEFPPPYTNPPANIEAKDYRVSYGTSYYDNNYRPKEPKGEQDFGAMMEHYSDFCLPIFGWPENKYEFTCAFVSLGKTAYFLEYKSNSEDAPKCYEFSPNNHPPRPDFLKHLDYWPEASKQLNGSVQAYYWKQLWQKDAEPRMLFAYAFNREKSLQGNLPIDNEWYQRPQSFFFTGQIAQGKEMTSPMISQNYTSFRTEQPNPKLWQQVENWCKQPVPLAHLFPGQ